MKISVTQQDIDCGTPLNEAYCPVARAIKRTIGNIAKVRVSPYSIDIGKEFSWLPNEGLTSWIIRYDFCGTNHVMPTEFELPYVN